MPIIDPKNDALASPSSPCLSPQFSSSPSPPKDEAAGDVPAAEVMDKDLNPCPVTPTPDKEPSPIKAGLICPVLSSSATVVAAEDDDAGRVSG